MSIFKMQYRVIYTITTNLKKNTEGRWEMPQLNWFNKAPIIVIIITLKQHCRFSNFGSFVCLLLFVAFLIVYLRAKRTKNKYPFYFLNNYYNYKKLTFLLYIWTQKGLWHNLHRWSNAKNGGQPILRHSARTQRKLF